MRMCVQVLLLRTTLHRTDRFDRQAGSAAGEELEPNAARLAAPAPAPPLPLLLSSAANA
jgi:hypothetical protein